MGQCPPKAWLPSNVSFRTWDFFAEVPSELVARYDVVHIRLIAVTIKNNDPTVVVKNLAKLLSVYPRNEKCPFLTWVVLRVHGKDRGKRSMLTLFRAWRLSAMGWTRHSDCPCHISGNRSGD